QLAVVPSEYSAQRLFEIPYVIDLDVVGEAAPGPELTGQGALEDRSATDPGPAPEAPDGGGASDDGGEVELEDPPSAEEAQRSSLPPLVWALLGGVGGGIVLAVVVIGAVVLVQRSRGAGRRGDVPSPRNSGLSRRGPRGARPTGAGPTDAGRPRRRGRRSPRHRGCGTGGSAARRPRARWRSDPDPRNGA